MSGRRTFPIPSQVYLRMRRTSREIVCSATTFSLIYELARIPMAWDCSLLSIAFHWMFGLVWSAISESIVLVASTSNTCRLSHHLCKIHYLTLCHNMPDATCDFNMTCDLLIMAEVFVNIWFRRLVTDGLAMIGRFAG